MKRYSIVIFVLLTSFLLAGCKQETVQETKKSNNNQDVVYNCTKFYSLNITGGNTLAIKAEVVSEDVKNVVSPNPGIISYLNCSEGDKVYKNTIIAKIQPDFQDSNIQSLVSQKQSLKKQLDNLDLIYQNTEKNYNIQLDTLKVQKQSLENQIDLIKQNIEKIKSQKRYGLADLDTQLSLLEKQLQDLQKSKQNLENLKNIELQKISSNLKNLENQIYAAIDDTLLQIDKVFGISPDYLHYNDKYEVYLSAKNTALKQEIKNEFEKLDGQDFYKMTGEDLSNYLSGVLNLVDLAKQAISESLPQNRFFPQTMIDSLYSTFSTFYANLVELKTNYDSLLSLYKSVEKNYNNQILNIDIQLKSTLTNIDNIKKNKKSSFGENMDVQLNNLKTQYETLNSNLKNIENQIKSVENQKRISLNQLENQILQIKSQIDTISSNLVEKSIYAGVNGKIQKKFVSEGNKVGPNTPLCQILPEKTNLKLNIYSNVPLNIGDKVWIIQNGKKYFLNIDYQLPFLDPISKSYVYQAYLPKELSLPPGQIITVYYEIGSDNMKVLIPIDFIVNRVDGKYVYVVRGERSEERGEVGRGGENHKRFGKITEDEGTVSQTIGNSITGNVADITDNLETESQVMESRDGVVVELVPIEIGKINGEFVEVLSGLDLNFKICR